MNEQSAPPAAPAEGSTQERPPRNVLAAVWDELKGLFWVLLAVLFFHSFVAKPFYIPSESMMPVLLEGDRLVVSKYAYGYSHVSPTIPNPAAIARMLVLRGPAEPWNITLPPIEGRLFGRYPTRGDIVIVTPPGRNDDYIKRVVGLPGDRIAMRGGRLILNGREVETERRAHAMVPVDANLPCGVIEFPGRRVRGEDGRFYCRLPVLRETLPNGVSYDVIDLRRSKSDDFGPVLVPDGHVFLMGDNRDLSSDSRVGPERGGLGGPVRVERLGGRAEFLTFSLDGTTGINPASWFTSMRDGRSFTTLRTGAEDE